MPLENGSTRSARFTPHLHGHSSLLVPPTSSLRRCTTDFLNSERSARVGRLRARLRCVHSFHIEYALSAIDTAPFRAGPILRTSPFRKEVHVSSVSDFRPRISTWVLHSPQVGRLSGPITRLRETLKRRLLNGNPRGFHRKLNNAVAVWRRTLVGIGNLSIRDWRPQNLKAGNTVTLKRLQDATTKNGFMMKRWP
jgi:hypothetical protein